MRFSNFVNSFSGIEPNLETAVTYGFKFGKVASISLNAALWIVVDSEPLADSSLEAFYTLDGFCNYGVVYDTGFGGYYYDPNVVKALQTQEGK